jgi:hypothetical protein
MASVVLRAFWFRAARHVCQLPLPFLPCGAKGTTPRRDSAKLFSALGLDHFNDGADLFEGEILLGGQLEMTSGMKLGRWLDAPPPNMLWRWQRLSLAGALHHSLPGPAAEHLPCCGSEGFPVFRSLNPGSKKRFHVCTARIFLS